MKLWIANTDPAWFDFLAKQKELDEVNFWQPSGNANFKAVKSGDLFLFKLKSPRNAIGGYGIFVESSLLPVSLAWDAFGIKNGVESYPEMRERIMRYRKINDVRLDFSIGCRVVVNPVFLPENLWIPEPESWSKSIVVGKTYDTSTEEGLSILHQLEETHKLMDIGGPFSDQSLKEPLHSYRGQKSRFGNPFLKRARLGQGAFRVSIIEAYGRECALSEGRVLPALEAAHIRSYRHGGEHKTNNGLLLRRDIHSVFDAGYATFDDDLKFVVSNRVKTEFNNGNEYLRLKGKKLKLPMNMENYPDLDNIRWHQNNIFMD